MRPLEFVPLDDKHLSKLRCSVEQGGTLLVTYDAALFNEEWSGIVECRFKTAQAQSLLEHLVRDAA